MRANLRPATFAVAFATACATAPAPVPMSSVNVGWVEQGEASWYGPGFHGNRTASGEIYDMEAMTAAHRELPFGSWVRVVNLDNGRQTDVRINDRGPFARGRILDVSRAAARELEMIGSGTARVRIEIIEGVAAAPRADARPADIPSGCSLVQVGAYRERRNATEMVRRLEARGEPVRSIPGADGIIRVYVGPYENEAETRLVRDRYDGLIRSCDS